MLAMYRVVHRLTTTEISTAFISGMYYFSSQNYLHLLTKYQFDAENHLL